MTERERKVTTHKGKNGFKNRIQERTTNPDEFVYMLCVRVCMRFKRCADDFLCTPIFLIDI